MKIDIQQFNPDEEVSYYFNSKPTFEQAWHECDNGQYLIWIAYRLDIDDRLLTLVQAYLMNSQRYLMSDKAVEFIDASIAYGEGKTTKEEFNKFLGDFLNGGHFDAFNDDIPLDKKYSAKLAQKYLTDEVFRAVKELENK